MSVRIETKTVGKNMDRARPLNGTSCGKRLSFPYALNIIIDLLFNFLILSNVSEIL